MIWWHFASRGSDEMSEDCWWEVESTMSGATRYPSSDSYSDIEDGRHDNVDMACRLHIHDYTWVSLCCSTCASSRGFLSVLFLSCCRSKFGTQYEKDATSQTACETLHCGIWAELQDIHRLTPIASCPQTMSSMSCWQLSWFLYVLLSSLVLLSHVLPILSLCCKCEHVHIGPLCCGMCEINWISVFQWMIWMVRSCDWRKSHIEVIT